MMKLLIGTTVNWTKFGYNIVTKYIQNHHTKKYVTDLFGDNYVIKTLEEVFLRGIYSKLTPAGQSKMWEYYNETYSFG